MNPKRERFVIEYIANGGNGAEAARAAGYGAAGAHVTASRLLRKPEVAEAIALRQKAAITAVMEQREKVERSAQVTAERVMEELARIAFFDVRSLWDADGNLVAPHLLPDDTARALSEVIETERVSAQGVATTTRRLKAASKMEALTFLGKHFGLVQPDIQVTNNNLILTEDGATDPDLDGFTVEELREMRAAIMARRHGALVAAEGGVVDA